MKVWRPNLAVTPESRGEDRRRHGRLKTEGTQSSLGEVVDISASGMRVVRKGALPVREGEKFRVDLQIEQQIMPIDVEVRRVSKLGRRKFEFGLEFINLGEDERRRLISLARTASTSARTMW
ncbi:MAG: PilZ domain-containing protein [Planctomycetota bacterium]